MEDILKKDCRLRQPGEPGVEDQLLGKCQAAHAFGTCWGGVLRFRMQCLSEVK